MNAFVKSYPERLGTVRNSEKATMQWPMAILQNTS